MRIIEQDTFNKSSNLSLILANLIPIYGVIFMEWKVFDIVIFYWIETFIIGLFNVIKINMCQGKVPANEEESAKEMGTVFHWLYIKGKEAEEKNGSIKKQTDSSYQDLNNSSKNFISIFFLFHYNFFIFVQFMLIIGFITPKGAHFDTFDLFKAVSYVYHHTDYIIIGISGIIISHAYSLYIHFYKDQEYMRTSPGVQMFKPYVRIFVQQFVVILGGGIAMIFNAPIIALVLLVIFKIIVDLISHNFSHHKENSI